MKKTSGSCTNGGCVRLATVLVVIPGLGERQLCWMCHQGIYRLFGTLRVVKPSGAPRGGAA